MIISHLKTFAVCLVFLLFVLFSLRSQRACWAWVHLGPAVYSQLTQAWCNLTLRIVQVHLCGRGLKATSCWVLPFGGNRYVFGLFLPSDFPSLGQTLRLSVVLREQVTWAEMLGISWCLLLWQIHTSSCLVLCSFCSGPKVVEFTHWSSISSGVWNCW